jgi:hypothetical protein
MNHGVVGGEHRNDPGDRLPFKAVGRDGLSICALDNKSPGLSPTVLLLLLVYYLVMDVRLFRAARRARSGA